MESADEAYKDPFAELYEPFAGLNEMDFELYGIYMDHEPAQEFVTKLDKCRDAFLNVLLTNQNLRNESIRDEARADGYQPNPFGDTEEQEEVPKNTFRIHDPNVRWDLMEAKVGDVFESPAQLKYCVTNYAVNGGYQIYFGKSDSTRVLAKCGKRNEESLCPYRLYAAWMYNDKTFQVKSLNPEHKCSRVFKFGSIVNPEWLGRHYVSELANKPKVKLKEMIGDIQRNYKCVVSIGQVRRAKEWAKELIEGKLTEHYARIWDYAEELMRSNPGSTCKVGVIVNPDEQNCFQRFYICFNALSVCWKRGCRKVIGLDGCFLKGLVKGELLTAIGRDANNQVFPIAWAVVDVENKANWTWFLELLKDDLGLGSGADLVVISDQHKGLLEAVKDILPHVEHRNCARHIYANFRKAFSGLEYKKLFWAAAMSCVEGNFKKIMERLKRLNPSAYEYLMSKEPKTWCRAYMSAFFACEAVENGISECFNSIIVEARKKPLITMLEEIRIYVMDRFAHMTEECTKWNGDVCPAVIKKMRLFGKNMRLWYVVHSLGNVFEVRRGGSSYRVDLDKRLCSCRLWDMSGIPCVHGIAAINYIHQTPEGYISDWFSKEKFLECYSSNISPVNGSNLWPETEYIKPLPPIARRMPGRPATCRRKHPSETESRFGSTTRVRPPRTVRCGNCLQIGHNKKGCKNEKRTPIHVPPKKIGRPRKTETSASMHHATQPTVQATQPTVQSTGPTQASQQANVQGGASSSGVRKRKSREAGVGTSTSGVKKRKSRATVRVDPAETVVADVEPTMNVDPAVNVEPAQTVAADVEPAQVVVADVEPAQESLVDITVNEESSLFDIMVTQDDGLNVPLKNVGGMVGEDLKETLDEVGAAMDEILGSGSEGHAIDVEENAEPEFTEGHATDLVPEKLMLEEEEVGLLLESGYTMEEIKDIQGYKVPVPDSPPSEMELTQDIPGFDGGEPAGEEAGEGYGDGAEGDGGEADGEGDGGEVIQPLVRRRTKRPSERIMKLKLKKAVYDRDGGGVSAASPVILEE